MRLAESSGKSFQNNPKSSSYAHPVHMQAHTLTHSHKHRRCHWGQEPWFSFSSTKVQKSALQSPGTHRWTGAHRGLCWFFKFYLFTFGRSSSRVLRELFSGCGQQGLLCLCGTRASYCRDFSCCGARAPGCGDFSSCSARAPEHRLRSCEA